MAGKAYSLREMKAIVDYLNERKAYGELKGRKMWMEFASSEKTTRTWQSLKETFLKRILPDIQNPYYHLTMDQVRSFRQGVDVVEKEKNNRLEFRTADEKSNVGEQNDISTAVTDKEVPTTSHANDEQTNDNDEPPVTSIDDALEKVTGEDVKAAKLPSRRRSSVEIVVPEYENAEDVQRALESPSNEGRKSKSLKDMLIFENTAPLTPLVCDLLKDFQTESEESDAEPRLNIDENPPRTDNNVIEAAESETVKENALEHSIVEINEANSTIENLYLTVTKTAVTEETLNKDQVQAASVESHNHENQEPRSQNENNENNNKNKTNTQKHNDENSQQGDAVTNTESNLKDTSVFVAAESNAKTLEKSLDTAKNNTDSNSIIANTGSSTQNNTSDTLLPNNQEALDDSKETQKTKHDANNEIADKEKTAVKKTRLRKRSSSKDSKKSKKQKLDIQSKEINDENSVIEIKDSSSPILEKKSVNANTPIVENRSTTPSSCKKDHLAKPTSKSGNKSSATNEDDSNSTLNKEKNTTEVEDKNPYQLSVSPFEEQFKNTKYSDNDSDEATKQKQNLDKPQTVTNKVKKTKPIPQKIKDKKEKNVVGEEEIAAVVENSKNVDSNHDSSADCESQSQVVSNNTNVNASANQRERAFANLFGFAHGHVASTTRKRQLSHRRRSHHKRRRYSKNMESNSSDSMSESDSDSYVLPPNRGGRNKHTKKYLIPKQSRILQDPEEGFLYVIVGKSIYPLVKDEKHIKKFLTYRLDSGSDKDESFWRKKYIEEKRKADEVKMLFKEDQPNNAAQLNESTQPSTSRNNTSAPSPQKSAQNGNNNNAIAPVADNKTEARDEKKLLLKISGNNGVEYSLEGDWDQISHVMPQVVRMLKSDMAEDNRKLNQVNGADERTKVEEARMETSSGVCSPVPSVVDADVHEKISKIEQEIFDKIKILDAHGMEEVAKTSEMDSTNVTRRGRPRNTTSATSTSKSPAKRTRTSKTNSTDSKQEEPKTKRASRTKPTSPDANQEEKEIPAVTTEDSPKQKEKKLPKKVAEKQVVEERRSVRRSVSKQTDMSDHNSSAGDKSVVGTRASTRILKMSKRYDTDSSTSEAKLRATPTPTKQPTERRSFGDENARYMFPPDKTNKTNPGHKRSLLEIIIVPPQELGNSVDSYGYQDSDPSPVKVCLPKRKRKVSFTVRNKYKNKHLTRRKTYSVLVEPSSDSNNSSYFIPLRRSLSSLNSAIYRSDSYQILMSKQRRSSKKLESIDENNPVIEDSDVRHFYSVSKDSNKSSDNSGFILEMGSSSNVTLPCSPELSVVEKMSISREMIKDANYPTINETQQNVSCHQKEYSEYMISNLDISVPLMDQRCKLRKSVDRVTAQNANKSESMQLKDCTVNLTLSETLDRRLRELLLESTKKPTQDTANKQTPMEVDQTIVTTKKPRARKQKENVAMDVDETKATTKKTRAKKRSSTPQKKKTASKMKAPKDSTIEEEHVESCSAGRKSCPPVITFMPVDENANNSSDVVLNPAKSNPKKKKDIIKVKIQKPKHKSRSAEYLCGKYVGDGSIASTYTDSGINDTETISLVLKDSSVDLIHNHSETCLLANECIGNNSVEFVQNSPISIISLSNSRESEDSAFFRRLQDPIPLSEDTSNNQETMPCETRTQNEVVERPETRNPTRHTSISSLITEDLSNSPTTQPTKWYLLDEDITNLESASHVPSFGSNLKQIFPIACAVPDLSTISEMSRENEDSRKTQ